MELEPAWNDGDYAKYSLEGQRERLQFIRKVYSILTLQVLLTVLFVLLACFIETYKNFVALHPWVFIVSTISAFVLLCILYCFKSINRQTPYNYLLLTLFTLLKSVSISAVCVFYDPMAVFLAAFCTFCLTFCLTVYACTTKNDFTVMRGLLIVLGLSVFILFVLCIVLGASELYHYIYCPLAVALFGIYLVYDTQLIVGEKRHKLSYDDYILGALMLYIDIIGIFIHLLRLNRHK